MMNVAGVINAIPNMDRKAHQRVRENTRVWAGVYFFVALAAAFAMALLTPPLQVPNEHRHFYRKGGRRAGGGTARFARPARRRFSRLASASHHPPADSRVPVA